MRSRAEYMRIYRQKKREEKTKTENLELKRIARSSTQRSRDFRARAANPTDEQQRTRMLANARMRKYREKIRKKKILERMKKLKKLRPEELVIERRKELARERSRRYREKKRINGLEPIDPLTNDSQGSSHANPLLATRKRISRGHHSQMSLTSINMHTPLATDSNPETRNCNDVQFLQGSTSSAIKEPPPPLLFSKVVAGSIPASAPPASPAPSAPLAPPVSHPLPAPPSPPVSDADNGRIRECYLCNICKGGIQRFRYICMQCPDFDLCEDCKERGEHEEHYVVRVPGARPSSEIATVPQNIPQESAPFNAASARYCHSVKLELKVEFDPVGDDTFHNETRVEPTPYSDDNQYIKGDIDIIKKEVITIESCKSEPPDYEENEPLECSNYISSSEKMCQADFQKIRLNFKRENEDSKDINWNVSSADEEATSYPQSSEPDENATTNWTSHGEAAMLQPTIPTMYSINTSCALQPQLKSLDYFVAQSPALIQALSPQGFRSQDSDFHPVKRKKK